MSTNSFKKETTSSGREIWRAWSDDMMMILLAEETTNHRPSDADNGINDDDGTTPVNDDNLNLTIYFMIEGTVR